MKTDKGPALRAVTPPQISIDASALHPRWRALIRYCAELQHGEIELLKIQDGLPVLAEVTRKKVKFAL
jgi:hypothetical protein